MTSPDRIITHHVSPYHAIQGKPDDVRRIVGRLPSDPPEFWHRCEECSAPIGAKHRRWCPEDGIVTEAQTYGGRNG